jgi:hypothetical protein
MYELHLAFLHFLVWGLKLKQKKNFHGLTIERKTVAAGHKGNLPKSRIFSNIILFLNISKLEKNILPKIALKIIISN